MTVRRLVVPVILGCCVVALAAPATAARPSSSIVGTWQRVIHCQDLVRALTDAGLGDYAPGAAEEFVHVTPQGVADAAHPLPGRATGTALAFLHG
jgi:hypothetical protein